MLAFVLVTKRSTLVKLSFAIVKFAFALVNIALKSIVAIKVNITIRMLTNCSLFKCATKCLIWLLLHNLNVSFRLTRFYSLTKLYSTYKIEIFVQRL